MASQGWDGSARFMEPPRSDEETFGCWFEALEVGDYGTVACGHVFETEATLLVGYLAAGFSTAHINVSVTPGTITG